MITSAAGLRDTAVGLTFGTAPPASMVGRAGRARASHNQGTGTPGRSPEAKSYRYRHLVSQPEMQRQVRQQRADIDSLYELVEGVDHKVDTLTEHVGALDAKVNALDAKVDRRFDELSGQLAEVLRQLGGR